MKKNFKKQHHSVRRQTGIWGGHSARELLTRDELKTNEVECSWNKQATSFCLKDTIDGADPLQTGMLFQTVGVAELKARS